MADENYSFGPFVFDSRRKILRRHGTVVALGQRGLALLEALLAAGGQTVSKADLMDAAWRSENIEESNLSVQIAALRKSLGRSANGEDWIRTVQRSGYQLVTSGVTEPAAAPVSKPDKPSIAVLPFANLSSGIDQEYFADGLAEDLITDLSKVRGLLTIARHSSFAFRDKAMDVARIAAELGVRYIIDGSVRRASGQVRINVQLIDVTSGNHLWADRFDCSLTDIFAVQDDVVGKIIAALADVLPSVQPLRKRRVPDLDAYDLFVRGRLLSMQSPEGNSIARPLLEKACALDPGFAEAQAWLAMNLLFGWMYCYQEDSRQRVLELAPKAVLLDPDNADAHVILGYVLIFNGDSDLAGGHAQFDIALKLNPNHADAWLFLADLNVLEGQPEQALAASAQAFHLNPHPPPYYHWLQSWILYAAKHYQDIAENYDRVESQAIGLQRILAATLAQLGRLEEARDAGRRFMAAVPQFTISSWSRTMPFRNDADRTHFIEGFRKAGLPE